MKKLTFFVAVLISLNASVSVRKPEEESNSISEHKNYFMTQKQTYAMWLQSFVQMLRVNFYGISKTGKIHTFSWKQIQEIVKQKNNSLNKVSSNRVFYSYYEKGTFG